MNLLKFIKHKTLRSNWIKVNISAYSYFILCNVVLSPVTLFARIVYSHSRSSMSFFQSSYSGLSGLIRFEDGRRKEFDLEVTSLVPRGLIRVGFIDILINHTRMFLPQKSEIIAFCRHSCVSWNKNNNTYNDCEIANNHSIMLWSKPTDLQTVESFTL